LTSDGPKVRATAEQVAEELAVRRVAWLERLPTSAVLQVQAASFFDRKNRHPGVNRDLTRRGE